MADPTDDAAAAAADASPGVAGLSTTGLSAGDIEEQAEAAAAAPVGAPEGEHAVPVPIDATNPTVPTGAGASITGVGPEEIDGDEPAG
jgi:hypothetical protein